MFPVFDKLLLQYWTIEDANEAASVAARTSAEALAFSVETLPRTSASVTRVPVRVPNASIFLSYLYTRIISHPTIDACCTYTT